MGGSEILPPPPPAPVEKAWWFPIGCLCGLPSKQIRAHLEVLAGTVLEGNSLGL